MMPNPYPPQETLHGNREYARQGRFGIGEMRTEVDGQQPSELAWNPAYENGLCLD